jgi:hypothetical protein
MNPILFLYPLLITIGDGILTLILAVALVIFIVGFGRVVGNVGPAVFGMEEGFNFSKVSGC